MLEVWIVDMVELDCDGCGRPLVTGEVVISNITSCCGGGCVRNLCHTCIEQAMQRLQVHRVQQDAAAFKPVRTTLTR